MKLIAQLLIAVFIYSIPINAAIIKCESSNNFSIPFTSAWISTPCFIQSAFGAVRSPTILGAGESRLIVFKYDNYTYARNNSDYLKYDQAVDCSEIRQVTPTIDWGTNSFGSTIYKQEFKNQDHLIVYNFRINQSGTYHSWLDIFPNDESVDKYFVYREQFNDEPCSISLDNSLVDK